MRRPFSSHQEMRIRPRDRFDELIYRAGYFGGKVDGLDLGMAFGLLMGLAIGVLIGVAL